jgi:hypothetical protein
LDGDEREEECVEHRERQRPFDERKSAPWDDDSPCKPPPRGQRERHSRQQDEHEGDETAGNRVGLRPWDVVRESGERCVRGEEERGERDGKRGPDRR